MVKYQPKVLFFDIESTNLSDAFGSILSIAYKWAHEKKVHCIAAWDFPKTWNKAFYDDSAVLNAFYEIVKDADKVVYHFGMWFDHLMVNTRTARNGLRDADGHIKFIPSDIKKVDTYILAKKNLKLDRRRLDNIAEALGCKHRKDHPGADTWKRVMNREPAAMRQMVSYNKQDVRVLEAVYNELREFDRQSTHPNKHGKNCPSCGSDQIRSNGLRADSMGVYRRLSCLPCGRRFRGRLNL